VKTVDIYELFLRHPYISTDSRSVKKDSIFFALRGKNFDGNRFAMKALADGAAYAITDKSYFKPDKRLIRVEDSLGALQSLANHHRKKCSTKILAITGSNGKTTTKELIKRILSEKYKVYATAGNLNNHIGVPLTLLSMPSDSQIGIIEMGANHHGEIQELCNIAEPDFGLITNIGKAHMEGFGSLEDIAKAKAELFEYLKSRKGKIYGNINNSYINAIIPEKYSDAVLYGVKNSACWGQYISSGPFLKMLLFMPGDSSGLQVNTNLVGRYNMENVVAAAAFAHSFNLTKDSIKTAIEDYIPEDNRSQLVKTKDNIIYLDAYNANPTSMRAALDSFIDLKVQNKCFILGEMLEIGDASDREHQILLTYLKENNITNVLCVGKAFYKNAKKFGFKYFNDANELAGMLKSGKIKNANIFLKGSRANQLEKLVKFL
jgi:UDP-N-acetylmuramoyl-tripeptide--D-alanyl-D-alanine ligase